MSWTASSRTFASAGLIAVLAGCAAQPRGVPLFSDDFADARHWVLEDERPARVVAREGVLDIDTPAGLTLWFKQRLEGPVEIEFEAAAISAGGANDQVSDLNVFWMARNAEGADPPYLAARSGRFAMYDDLVTYYVGLGGNRNTTSRFRRYVGQPGNRPLLPEHDRTGPEVLLEPNRWQRISLLAAGSRIEYRRDGRVLFRLDDAAPYTQGWFALRTTWSHLRVRNFKIRRPVE